MSTGPALGLHTDLYELRMVETYLRRGMTADATFSLFARPSVARPWLLSAGLDEVLRVLRDFRFDRAQLDYLADQDVPDDTLDHLRDLRFEGEVWAVPDGTVVLGDEPLVEVTAPLPVAQLVETAVMNAMHLDTLVATKAARCVHAAGDATVVDFGFRRAHGLAGGVRAARAAWVGGISATSNVEAGHRWGLPITGTMAHAFVQAFEDEEEAFRAFLTDHPDSTTLLVDTYDVERGIQRAITVAREAREAGDGASVGAIRIDSDPLDEFARRARRELDAAGLPDVRIVVSGGLDEHAIADLLAAGAPIDGFGVGTALVTSSDKPSLDLAYKLVAYDGVDRAKYSPGKRFLPGAKQVFRDGSPATDVLELRDADHPGTPLLEQVWSGTAATVEPHPDTARDRAAEQLATLPDGWRALDWQDDPPRPRTGPSLDTHADRVARRELD